MKNILLGKNTWKIISIVLLLYTFIFGFLGEVPQLPILEQSIRNLYFHVPMWFTMMLFYIIGLVYSFRVLFSKKDIMVNDIYALEFNKMGTILGILGLITGAVWANYTWGEPWSNDPKQVGALISLLIYFAYFILRIGVNNSKSKVKSFAVFNIFSFAMLFPCIWILPRLVDSLHPGGEGNPAMNTNDIDVKMRIVFYPAVIGWFFLALWITTISLRIKKIQFILLKNK